MFKKVLLPLALGLSLCQASLASDALHLEGLYTCSGNDSHDGAYKDVTLKLTVDEKNSDFAHNFGAYHFQLLEGTTVQYTGEAAASGNTLAIYFENTSAEKPTDRGVGIAVVSHDNGTVIHKFYYEPTYQGGGNGSETCVKTS